jgi:hypothetical protein
MAFVELAAVVSSEGLGKGKTRAIRHGRQHQLPVCRQMCSMGQQLGKEPELEQAVRPGQERTKGSHPRRVSLSVLTSQTGV